MSPTTRLRERVDPDFEQDPRDGEGAQVIDLATRNVMPTVSQRSGGEGFGMVAGVAIVAALGGLTLWMMSTSRVDETNKTAQQPGQEFAQSAGSPLPEIPVGPMTDPNAPAAQVPMPPAALSAPAPSPVLANPPSAAVAMAPAGNPYSSPTIVFDAGAGGVTIAASPGVGKDGAPSGNSNDDFAARIGGVGGGTAAVAKMTFDPATTVGQGTLIPAILETAIDTDVPGFVRAIVSTDVRSFDGKRVLVPRSSRLIGQYKSGLSAGQKRAYVIWTRLIRPDGVSVDIASPAVGFNGQTGLAGKVDSHFFQRFGSAMLLSVVGGLSAIGGNASVIVGGSGQSAAAAAVGQTGNIGPTIRVRQGEPIRVFTAKDLDFSKVS